jgi:hypothetical protein
MGCILWRHARARYLLPGFALLLVLLGALREELRAGDDGGRESAQQCLTRNTAHAYLRQLDDFDLRLSEVQDFLEQPRSLPPHRVVFTVPDKSSVPVLVTERLQQWRRLGFEVDVHDDKDMAHMAQLKV